MFQKKKSRDGAKKKLSAAPREDEFLWLEGVDDEDALAWVRAENKQAEHVLVGDRRFRKFYDDAFAILNSTQRIAAPSLFRNTVRNFWQDENHVRGLWRETSLDDYLDGNPQWTTLLDFDALAELEGENWVFGGANALAPECDRVMLTLSRGGSDAAVRREFSVSDGGFVAGGFELGEAKGATAWRDANALFVALADAPQYATNSGYPRSVRLLKRGESLATAKTIFEGQTTDIGVWPASIYKDGKTWTFITRSLTFFESEQYLIDDAGKPQKLPVPLRSEIESVFDGKAIISLQQAWKVGNKKFLEGTIISLDLKTGEIERVFTPSPTQSVEAISTGQSALYLQVLDNVVGKVIQIIRKGGSWRAQVLDLPGKGAVTLGSVNAYGDDLFLYYDSPIVPPTLFYVDRHGNNNDIYRTPAFFSADEVIVEQRHVRSKDGVDIPYFVIGKKAVIKNGRAPVIQYGYGGFEVPVTPSYSGVMGKVWLENGGVYVIANIRGGGEFGPAWHQAAQKRNRQKAFDDFFAVSGDLIASGLTTTNQLGAYGASNGGLLMGVALTQRPDLYKALAIGVPLLDMMRFHKLLAGASWVDEYGDPEDAEDRAFLESYSPYHQLQEDRTYPEPFFFTSTKDDRVHPGHARKMAAKMRSMGHGLFYFENIEGGHGAAANRQQEAYRSALQYVYFHRKLVDQR